MRVLAVIPARAGSKAIPNKNIRFINGHPMIYYAINNAVKSKYITEVIVTTDSPEVEIIAKQMNVGSHWRDARLCEDEVTLDAVIFDAVEQFEKRINDKVDYVITMQPTSPTLKVESLDSGIEYALGNDIDTLISAVNRPHLAWTERDGKKQPEYVSRVNRQYLPAHFQETGAFVISKRDVVCENTRIGKSVDVFELSDEEAVDVDSFVDLMVVSEILSQKKIAIYVNGNNKRGMGHIYRALELADEFMSKPDIYFDYNQTDRSVFGNTTHNIIPVNGIFELFEAIKNKQYSIVINDILDTSLDYMIGLRSVLGSTGKIINFEDDGEGACQADMVFNALFTESNTTNIFGGEKYYIAPKIFMLYEPIEIKEKVKSVFISFGGADPQNYTDRILDIITKEKYSDIEFVIALGRAKNNVDILLEYNKYANLNILYDVKNMPELMSGCDVAVTSRGRTAYELAMLGIPAIVISQNKREESHGFLSDEHGFMYLGTEPSNHIIESTLDMFINMPQLDRESIQKIMLGNELKDGRKRVISLIQNI